MLIRSTSADFIVNRQIVIFAKRNYYVSNALNLILSCSRALQTQESAGENSALHKIMSGREDEGQLSAACPHTKARFPKEAGSRQVKQKKEEFR